MIPASIDLLPIDDGARNGRWQAVFGDGQFALVRWDRDGWQFSSGNSLNFEPTHYQRRPSPIHEDAAHG